MRKIILLSSLLLSSIAFSQTPTYVPASGLIAWWGFSGNANDASGNGNDLTVNGATLTNDRNGNPNSAYLFDGISNNLTKSSLSYTFSLSGAFSVSFWMNRTSNTPGVALYSGSSTAGNFIWLLQCDATKAIYGTNKQSQAWTWLNGPAYISSKWDHYVMTYNNQSMELYKNGVSVGTTTNTYTAVSQAALPFYIGNAISGGYIAATIDDVGIWNRPLTGLEVSQLYNSTLSTSEIKKETGNIAPNPAADFIQVNSLLKGVKNYKITDVIGRLISKGAIPDDKRINVSQLPKGIYFLEIEGIKNLKFIKK